MRTKFFYGVVSVMVVVAIISVLVIILAANANRPIDANPQASIPTITPVTTGVVQTQATPVTTGVVQTQTPAVESTANLNRIITIISVGQVKVVPDVAYLNVGSEVQALTASEAITKATTTSDAIYKALLREGISESNIQTSGINVYPVTDPTIKSPTSGPTGYHGSFSLYISISDLTKAGKILDSVTKAGANQISGLSFGIKDDTTYRAQAMEKAIQLARPKAEAIARNLGTEITQEISVVEVQNNFYGQSAAIGLGGKGDMGMSIMPGELAVSVQISITYGIR